MAKTFSESGDDWFKNFLERLYEWDWIESCPTKEAWLFSKTGKHSTWCCYVYWYTNDVCFFKHSQMNIARFIKEI